jgi:hypothetical protein
MFLTITISMRNNENLCYDKNFNEEISEVILAFSDIKQVSYYTDDMMDNYEERFALVETYNGDKYYAEETFQEIKRKLI